MKNRLVSQADAFDATLLAASSKRAKHQSEATKLRADIRRLEAAALEADQKANRLEHLLAKATAKNKEVAAENGQLRIEIYAAELDRERLRGYLDAVEDAKPRRMIEDPAHSYKLNTARQFTDTRTQTGTYGQKPWYAR